MSQTSKPEIKPPVSYEPAKVRLAGEEVSPNHKNKGGRPKVNREAIWDAIARGWKPRRIRKIFKISRATYFNIKKEMPPEWKPKEIEESFEEAFPEGKNFFEYLKSKIGRIYHVRFTYKFCEKIWREILKKKKFDREVIKDEDMVKILNWIKENHPADQQRFAVVRWRYVLRFLGWRDWLDTYFSVREDKMPRPIRTLPYLYDRKFYDEIFPQIIELGKKYLPDSEQQLEWETVILTKASTGMRTGSRHQERELWGTKIGLGQTNITILPEGKIVWNVLAKKAERWEINLIPDRLKEALTKLYKLRNHGDYLIKNPPEFYLSILKKVCAELDLNPPLQLHDMRKIFVTFLWLSGFPLEALDQINVGWKDLNTAKRHYLHIAKMMGETLTKQQQTFNNYLSKLT